MAEKTWHGKEKERTGEIKSSRDVVAWQGKDGRNMAKYGKYSKT